MQKIQCREAKENSKSVNCKSEAGCSHFNMNSSDGSSIHSVHHDSNVLVGQPCTTTLRINAVLPIIHSAHNVLIMCFFFTSHSTCFIFTSLLSHFTSPGRFPEEGNSVPFLMGLKKTHMWTAVSKWGASRCVLCSVTTWQLAAAVRRVMVEQGGEGMMRNSPGCWTVRWVCAPTSLGAALAPSAPALWYWGLSPAS